MGRFSKPAQVAAPLEEAHDNLVAPVAPVAPVAELRWQRGTTGDADAVADREASLRAGIVELSGPWASEALQAAIRLRLQTTPIISEKNDRAAMSVTAKFLQDTAIGQGFLDVTTALRREEINRFLALQKTRGVSEGTLRTRRGQLYEAARVVHPADFAVPHRIALGRSVDRQPTTADELAVLYHYAELSTDQLRDKFVTVLDLGSGVGARASEMRRVCGTDVRLVERADFHTVTVTLTNPQGGMRAVPVLDPAKAERLYERALRFGSARLLDSNDRNVVNRCKEHLQRRGVTVGFTADSLRYAWLLKWCVVSLPPAMLFQIADTYDTRVYQDLRAFLPEYRIDQLLGFASTLREVA